MKLCLWEHPAANFLATPIGLARILSGVHFFLPKKLTFFSRRPQRTSKYSSKSNPPTRPAKTVLGVHLHIFPVNYAWKIFFHRPGGCRCTHCTPWLRLWLRLQCQRGPPPYLEPPLPGNGYRNSLTEFFWLTVCLGAGGVLEKRGLQSDAATHGTNEGESEETPGGHRRSDAWLPHAVRRSSSQSIHEQTGRRHLHRTTPPYLSSLSAIGPQIEGAYAQFSVGGGKLGTSRPKTYKVKNN